MTDTLQPAKKNNIILEERQRLSVSGVTDSGNFNDSEVFLYTTLGELEIRGKKLHMEEMSLETGEAVITGEIKSISYGDRDRTKKPSLWERITR